MTETFNNITVKLQHLHDECFINLQMDSILNFRQLTFVEVSTKFIKRNTDSINFHQDCLSLIIPFFFETGW